MGLVTHCTYSDLIDQARSFLKGQRTEIQANLIQQMGVLSENLAFEDAAKVRDRLKALHMFYPSKAYTSLDVPMPMSSGCGVRMAAVVCKFFSFEEVKIAETALIFRYTQMKTRTVPFSKRLWVNFMHNTPPPLILVSEDISDISVLEDALFYVPTAKRW